MVSRLQKKKHSLQGDCRLRLPFAKSGIFMNQLLRYTNEGVGFPPIAGVRSFPHENLFERTIPALVFRTGKKRRVIFIDILFDHAAG